MITLLWIKMYEKEDQTQDLIDSDAKQTFRLISYFL